MITSYAQNFEDVMLWRALKHVKEGFYVDVGAQHPIIDSVSLAFYEHGWRGVHIEPVPFYANLLREHRPDEVVIQAAIGARQGILTFFEVPETGLSTADREIAHRHKEKSFEVRELMVQGLTLAEALSPFLGKEIHWLKIDVEGYERQVIDGWGSKIKPWVVVIEGTLPLTQTESYQDWEPLILGLGYTLAYFDGLNCFFVSSEHAELLSAFRYGPTIFDDFALSGSASAPFCANLNSKIQELDRCGKVVEAELKARERQLIDTSRSLEEREEMLAQSRERVEALKKEFAYLHAQSDILRENLATAQQHTAHVESELGQTRDRAQWLENEWNAAKAKIDELNHHSQHWQLVSDSLNHQLQAVHASRSWRLTAPLRRGNYFAKEIVTTLLGGIINTIRRLPVFVRLARKVKIRFPWFWEGTGGRFFHAVNRHRSPSQESEGKDSIASVASIGMKNSTITLSEVKHRLQEEVNRQKSRGLK